MVRRFGPYEVVRQIGRGGCGIVYEATDPERSLRVALKSLPELGPAAAASLKREFRAAASVRHRNVVRLYELSEFDGRWFFTMELLQGLPLSTRVDEPGFHQTFGQLACAVDALHRQGVLHLDLKPANVLVEPEGRVVVLDFGIARTADVGQGRTGALVGTPHYMAPEQLARRAVGPAADWYAFGVLLYQALTGALPFDDPFDVLEADATVVPPRDRSPRVSSELNELCLALLDVVPERRPAAEAVLRAFDVERPPRPATPQLIGREAQLAGLEAALGAAASGRPTLVRLVGASGAGKSALSDELAARLKRTGVVVLRGRCYEWESGGYKGLDSAMEQLAELLAESPVEPEVRAAAAQLFPALAAQQRRAPAQPRAGAAEERARAFTAVKQLVARASESSALVLLLDDVHWGDVDGARLVRELLSPPNAPRLMVVVAYRPDERSAFIATLDEAAELPAYDDVRVAVEPLTVDEGARLARQLAPGLDDARCAHLAAEGEGNPFFIGELARLGAADTKPALDDVVQARVRRLAPVGQRVVEVIAVAGRLAEQDLAITAAGAGDPHEVLSVLRAESLIRTRGPRRSDSVELYHDRIRQSVLRSLAPSRRRDIHHALARTLERSGAADPHVLSIHWEGAGEPETAARHAGAAADAAFAALAFEQAAVHCRRALALGGAAAPERPRLCELLGRALFNAGRGAEAGDAFLDAASMAPAERQRALRLSAVESLLTSGQVRRGVEVLEPLAGESGEPFHRSTWRATASVATELLRLRFTELERAVPATDPQRRDPFRADLCWTIGRGLGAIMPVQGVDFLFRALNRALELGDPHRLVRALTMQGTAMIALGPPLERLGRACFERAVSLADELREPVLQGTVLVFRGFSEIAGAGRWGLARAWAEEGVELLRRHASGVAWEIDMGLGVRFKALEPSGDVTRMGQEAVEWTRNAADRGDLYTQNVAASFVVPYLLARDELDAAMPYSRRLLAPWEGADYTVQHYHATRLEAACDLYAGRPEAALRRLAGDRAQMKKIQIHRLSLSRVELRALEAVIHVSLAGRSTASAQHVAKARALARQLQSEKRVDGRIHAEMISSCCDLIDTKGARGAEGLARARASYASADMPQWAWSVERRLAELERSPARREAADAWFQERGVRRPEAWVSQFVPQLPG